MVENVTSSQTPDGAEPESAGTSDDPTLPGAGQPPAAPRRRRGASRPAGPPVEVPDPTDGPLPDASLASAPVRAPRKRATKKTAVAPAPVHEDAAEGESSALPATAEGEQSAALAVAQPEVFAVEPGPAAAPARPARRSTAKRAASSAPPTVPAEPEEPDALTAADGPAAGTEQPAPELIPRVVFQPPVEPPAPRRRRRATTSPTAGDTTTAGTAPAGTSTDDSSTDDRSTDDVPTDDVPAGDSSTGVVPSADLPSADLPSADLPSADAARDRDRLPSADAGAGDPVAPRPPVAAFVAPPTPEFAESEPAVRPARRRRAVREQGRVDEPGAILASAPLPAVAEPQPTAEDVTTDVLLDASGSVVEGAAADRPETGTLEDADPATRTADDAESEEDADGDEQRDTARRRRRRGGRGRRSRSRTDTGDASEHVDEEESAAVPVEDAGDDEEDAEPAQGAAADADEDSGSSSRRRRRRRRRGGGEDDVVVEEVERPATRTRERRPRTRDEGDEVQSVRGSTRLEAKKQRRREGRDVGRRRTPLLTEAEFLARREAVERTMIVRQRGKRTQMAVLEDGMLVEHYLDNGDTVSLLGDIFLGRVQNVLPSMEAAFLDLGKGRNAVLYAGEVNWDAAGLDGQPKRIELALKSGDPVLVQVTKDPIGSKGARLTSQISLPGRFLVYVPGGSMTGISRKLPENERTRLKAILRRVVPEDAGVIVRTAAEGASEEDIAADVARLQEQWEQVQKAATTATAPALLHGEPDLTVRVLRDVFNEDFRSVVVSGEAAWATIAPYLGSVAPDLADRVERWTGDGDVFAAHRIDEQLAKALDRKVFLPSGGSLVIDRTEAMVVVDVNTGRFTGKGSGNLEETVTKNNIEAAEEIVRQLRLRDMGGIIVIDFIDMVLESNRDLVMRRLLECLGRDRTKHQVAEVTSLGLVQMTRKRVGTGLLEAFSEPCEHCRGRGVILHPDLAPEAVPEPRRRPLILPGAPPSPALLAPAAPAAPSAPAAPIPPPVVEPMTVGPTAELVPDLADDPVALEDPVSELVSGPAVILLGEDPVPDVIDDGRPQRRRRRATRP